MRYFDHVVTIVNGVVFLFRSECFHNTSSLHRPCTNWHWLLPSETAPNYHGMTSFHGSNNRQFVINLEQMLCGIMMFCFAELY